MAPGLSRANWPDELEERSDRGYVPPCFFAWMHAGLGDRDRAFEWLERAYEQRETGLVKLQVDPDWDTLRDEPRFQELLRRMEFPPA